MSGFQNYAYGTVFFFPADDISACIRKTLNIMLLAASCSFYSTYLSPSKCVIGVSKQDTSLSMGSNPYRADQPSMLRYSTPPGVEIVATAQ